MEKLLVMLFFIVCLIIGFTGCLYLIIKILSYRLKRKIFLICPVNGVSNEENEAIEEYVKKLENCGHQVHWPYRDTNQNDKIGLRILKDNTKALRKADEVHIWYNKDSRGSIFDFGEAFILKKKIVIANPESIKPTPEKSFENALLEIHKQNCN